MQNCKNLNGKGSVELHRTNIIDMLGGLIHKMQELSS